MTGVTTFGVGDLVKVLFVVDPPVGDCTGERMWVRVIRIGNATALGILDNDPVVRTDLRAGEEVAFDLEDVLDVDTDNTD